MQLVLATLVTIVVSALLLNAHTNIRVSIDQAKQAALILNPLQRVGADLVVFVHKIAKPAYKLSQRL